MPHSLASCVLERFVPTFSNTLVHYETLSNGSLLFLTRSGPFCAGLLLLIENSKDKL